MGKQLTRTQTRLLNAAKTTGRVRVTTARLKRSGAFEEGTINAYESDALEALEGMGRVEILSTKRAWCHPSEDLSILRTVTTARAR